MEARAKRQGRSTVKNGLLCEREYEHVRPSVKGHRWNQKEMNGHLDEFFVYI